MKINYNSRIRIEFLNSFRKMKIRNYNLTCSPLHKDLWIRNFGLIVSSRIDNSEILKQKANIIFEKDFLIEEPVKIEKIVIKKCIHRNLLQFLISPFKRSKAAKTFLTAKHLTEHDLDTPVPLAVVEKRKLGFVTECYYVSEGLSPHQKVRKLVRKTGTDTSLLSSLAQTIACFTRKMHDSGMVHKDLNLANFLLYKEQSHIALIDLNRSSLSSRQISVPVRLKDISRMGWKDHLQEFLEEYTRREPAYEKWFWLLKKHKKIRKGRKRLKRKLVL